jgi:hypothetical protein
MASSPAPVRITQRRSLAARSGYVVAIGVNGLMLWVAHQLLEWGWPAFLTDDFERVLPLLTASLVAGMAVNVGFLRWDSGRFRASGDLVTSAFGLAVSLRLWAVFPFDFVGYDRGWSLLLHAGLVLVIFGSVIAMIAAVTRLVRGGTQDVGS